MHGSPRRLREDPSCRQAWIAGASVDDAPASVAAFAVVLKHGTKGPLLEVDGRTPTKYAWWGEDGRGTRGVVSVTKGTSPIHGAPETVIRYEKHTGPIATEPYPGTILAAEWMALYRLMPLLVGSEPAPVIVYTSRREIAEVLDGRAPLSTRTWLSRVQKCIVQARTLVERDHRMYLARRSESIFVAVIHPKDNRRAERLAKLALLGEERPLVNLNVIGGHRWDSPPSHR